MAQLLVGFYEQISGVRFQPFDLAQGPELVEGGSGESDKWKVEKDPEWSDGEME